MLYDVQTDSLTIIDTERIRNGGPVVPVVPVVPVFEVCINMAMKGWAEDHHMWLGNPPKKNELPFWSFLGPPGEKLISLAQIF